MLQRDTAKPLPTFGVCEKTQHFIHSLLASPPHGTVLGYPLCPTPTPRPLFLVSQEKKILPLTTGVIKSVL